VPPPRTKRDESGRDDPRAILQRVFGFDDFLPGQEAVVRRLNEGRSVLAVFPTGAGKSLCYQLPALAFDGLTLVISPLIALMKDQLDFLWDHDVPAARLDSSLDREETLAVFDDLNAGRLKLLYVSPERLGNERFLHSLRRRKISLLAVDEAHCISQWGHNFRPDYLKIAQLAKQLNVGRVLALTATATPEVAEDIAKAFDVAKADVVHTGFYRPNLNLFATPCTVRQRRKLLLSHIKARPPGPAIVYVTLQRTAMAIAQSLASSGYDARPYHAGMPTDDRNEIQDAFMESDRMIVVATIAFGMGVDKSDIRYVYHFNLPKSMENYAQEIGRAGRDGGESVCELFACADDLVTLENFSYGDTPTPQSVRGLVHEVLGGDDVFDVSVYDLSALHDVRPLVVKTLLTYLELEDLIHSTGPFYSRYQFQPQKTSQEMFGQFDQSRAEFLHRIFRHATKGRTWFTLDADEVSRRTGDARQRIVAALGFLEERGDMVVKASGVRQAYRLEQDPGDIEALCKRLDVRFQRREQQDVGRVRRMLGFAEHTGCLTQRLLAYFGEKREPCGHCGRCQGQPARPVPPPKYEPPGEEDVADLRRLRKGGYEALATPRQFARFYCGIASPAATRANLGEHPLFGRFASVPFREVLAFVEAWPR